MAPAYSVVVGIGDSVTAATHCACPGFVQPYAAHLPTSAGGPAGAVNLGTNGLTAAGLRTLVTTPTPTAGGVAQADTLLVTIGANDLLPLLPMWRASGCPGSLLYASGGRGGLRHQCHPGRCQSAARAPTHSDPCHGLLECLC